MRKRPAPPIASIELIPLLKMIAPYKVEIYDTRHGPEIVMIDNDKVVRRLRVSEQIADLVAEARGILSILPGLMSSGNH